MLALAFALVHLRGHLLAGELQHLLWLSNVATLVLAVGCLAARASIVGLALLWLALDALLWTVDVAVAGAAVDTALLTHVGSVAIAVVAARALGPPRAGTWWVATLGAAALVGVARLRTPAADNINFAFAAAPGWDGVAPHAACLAVLLGLAATVFFVTERVARHAPARQALVDHALMPALLAVTFVVTHRLLTAGVPPLIVSGLVVLALAGVVAVLERVRPDRDDYRALDQPFATDLAHFLFNYNLGYVVALAACALVAAGAVRLGVPAPWPIRWPLAAQVALAIALAEGASYWQHRLFHQIGWLWRFHALHHSGERLNMVRAARFHAADIGPGSFLVVIPLVLLQAPPIVVTWTAVLAGSLGLFQHANLRMRSARRLDRLLCTPAVHRLHHSRDRCEADANYGTTVMLFDRLFGTYRAPTAPGPRAVGIEGDDRPPGFLRQALAPFRRPAR